MILLYIVVSATFLVQSSNSAAAISGNNLDEEYRRIAPSKDELKHVLNKLLMEVAAPLNQLKRDLKTKHLRLSKKRKSKTRTREIPVWDKWTDWSHCSVSCGKGREIRWRHCLQNCDKLETEMEEKVCQLPACGGKLFGLIDL